MGGAADAAASGSAFNRPMTTHTDHTAHDPGPGAGIRTRAGNAPRAADGTRAADAAGAGNAAHPGEDDAHQHVETLIIGGGQAGLAMAHRLAERERPCVVLDAHLRVGDAWRTRWDSLRVFTPAAHDGLPGMPLPGPGFRFPTKDEMADYLEDYAAHFGIEVRTGAAVQRLSRDGGRFVARTSTGDVIEADNVVVATGAFQRARVPAFAPDLDPRITQLHSTQYRNPGQLQDGPVLVVGAGNSGADLALELAPGRRTYLAGDHPGHLPIRTTSWQGRLAFPLIWFAWSHVLSIRTPIGRRVKPKVLTGHEPLIRVKPKDLERAGVERTPRVAGVAGGLPVLDDGRTIDVPNVLWATGYRPDFAWIDDLATDDRGEPVQEAGVVDGVDGLFFLGLQFQYAFNSHIIGGVGRDAKVLAGRIERRMAATAPATG
jgi:putative flavoprotein involved in K+ transport